MTTKAILLIGLLGLLLTACGGDDSLSADEANRLAGELAERTQALSEDVTKTARALLDDPDQLEQARDELEELAGQARDLADEAEDLPEAADAREQLRDANERIAQAADDLAEADPAQQAVDEARAPLMQAEDRLGEAVDRLADEVPQDARGDLEALRERLSSEAP